MIYGTRRLRRLCSLHRPIEGGTLSGAPTAWSMVESARRRLKPKAAGKLWASQPWYCGLLRLPRMARQRNGLRVTKSFLIITVLGRADGLLERKPIDPIFKT